MNVPTAEHGMYTNMHHMQHLKVSKKTAWATINALHVQIAYMVWTAQVVRIINNSKYNYVLLQIKADILKVFETDEPQFKHLNEHKPCRAQARLKY